MIVFDVFFSCMTQCCVSISTVFNLWPFWAPPSGGTDRCLAGRGTSWISPRGAVWRCAAPPVEAGDQTGWLRFIRSVFDASQETSEPEWWRGVCAAAPAASGRDLQSAEASSGTRRSQRTLRGKTKTNLTNVLVFINGFDVEVVPGLGFIFEDEKSPLRKRGSERSGSNL